MVPHSICAWALLVIPSAGHIEKNEVIVEWANPIKETKYFEMSHTPFSIMKSDQENAYRIHIKPEQKWKKDDSTSVFITGPANSPALSSASASADR